MVGQNLTGPSATAEMSSAGMRVCMHDVGVHVCEFVFVYVCVLCMEGVCKVSPTVPEFFFCFPP